VLLNKDSSSGTASPARREIAEDDV
jgi:hypothetical protein